MRVGDGWDGEKEREEGKKWGSSPDYFELKPLSTQNRDDLYTKLRTSAHKTVATGNRFVHIHIHIHGDCEYTCESLGAIRLPRKSTMAIDGNLAKLFKEVKKIINWGTTGLREV